MKEHTTHPRLFEDLARVCMCAKCLEADADFKTEVVELLATLTPAECHQAIKVVRQDRETPDELQGLIEPPRLEQRYDYLIDALATGWKRFVLTKCAGKNHTGRELS